MDLKKLSAMAKMQRAADNEETQGISGDENEIINVYVPIQQEEIFVPVEDDEPDRFPEDGFVISDDYEEPQEDNQIGRAHV